MSRYGTRAAVRARTSGELNAFLELSEQHGQLVDWLRTYEGFCPLSPTVPECLEKFPLLNRERVDQAIRQVREERTSESPWTRASTEAIEFVLRAWFRNEGVEESEIKSLAPNIRMEVRRLLRSNSPVYGRNGARLRDIANRTA
jgi:hypothetical protein